MLLFVNEALGETAEYEKCCKTIRFLCNWLRVLQKLDDHRLLKLIGIDFTLYLVFLRHSGIFFLVLSLIVGVCHVPVYESGSPLVPPGPKGSTFGISISMDTFTILNVTDRHWKLVFSFYSALLFIPVATIHALNEALL